MRPVLPEQPEPVETPILGMSEPEVEAEIRRETYKVGVCRARAMQRMLRRTQTPNETVPGRLPLNNPWASGGPPPAPRSCFAPRC